jgi:hypothetical protein
MRVAEHCCSLSWREMFVFPPKPPAQRKRRRRRQRRRLPFPVVTGLPRNADVVVVRRRRDRRRPPAKYHAVAALLGLIQPHACSVAHLQIGRLSPDAVDFVRDEQHAGQAMPDDLVGHSVKDIDHTTTHGDVTVGVHNTANMLLPGDPTAEEMVWHGDSGCSRGRWRRKPVGASMSALLHASRSRSPESRCIRPSSQSVSPSQSAASEQEGVVVAGGRRRRGLRIVAVVVAGVVAEI